LIPQHDLPIRTRHDDRATDGVEHRSLRNRVADDWFAGGVVDAAHGAIEVSQYWTLGNVKVVHFVTLVPLTLVIWSLFAVLVALTVGAAAKERDRRMTAIRRGPRVAGSTTRIAS
jgi:hypothetical protein